MYTTFRVAFGFSVALAAAACGARQPTPEQKRAETPQRITVVGCLEQGEKPDEFLVAGRAVNRAVVPPGGSESGGLMVTETGIGGDPYRRAAPGARDDAAETITPRLIASGSTDLRAQLGHRIVATGEFEPASMQEKTGLLKADTVDQVAPTCMAQ